MLIVYNDDVYIAKFHLSSPRFKTYHKLFSRVVTIGETGASCNMGKL